MSDLDQIRAIKSQTLARVAEITAAPKPSYQIDGQSVDWNEHLRQLLATAAWCDAQLARAEPVELHSRACT